jgi:uncharacterized protein (DUF2249 family)
MPKDGSSNGAAAGDVVFDARPYQREGREPFPYIIEAMAKLLPGQAFRLINTFDPRPLEAVLEARSYRYTVRNLGPEHVEVRFTRPATWGPGDVAVVDRRDQPAAAALFQAVHVVRRLKVGEEFLIRLGSHPRRRRSVCWSRPVPRCVETTTGKEVQTSSGFG